MASKKLSDMTQEELWQLFPIILKEHSPMYFQQYKEMKDNLLLILRDTSIRRINHIGSTAVPNLLAKPTIDILLEIDDVVTVDTIISRLKAHNWILMVDEKEPRLWLVFNHGYLEDGYADKVFHLHVRLYDDWDELYFRNYLIEFSEVAQTYAQLKQKLAITFKHNRKSYTDSKTDFIKKFTLIARQHYKDRYKPQK